MEKSFVEIQKARIAASFNTDEGSAELRKSEILDIEKGGKVAFVGEKRVFGGRNYIKTKDGWKYHGKGTGQKRVAPATDHLMIEDGKHYMDVLDPDSGVKMFKPGDKVKYEDDSGKKYEGTISNREHPDGDMFEVDFKEVGGSKSSSAKASASDHLVVEDGKHYIDTLDPETGKKLFKPGDKVTYKDDSGREYRGVISNREHEDGDMFEVDFKEVDGSKKEKKTEDIKKSNVDDAYERLIGKQQ